MQASRHAHTCARTHAQAGSCISRLERLSDGSSSGPCLAHPSTGRGAGAHSAGQRLAVTAAPTSYPHSPSVSLVFGGRELTVSVKGWSATHSLLAAPWGLAATVLAPATMTAAPTSDPCTRIHRRRVHLAVTASQWAGGSGGLLEWSRPAPSRLGHVLLERSLVNRSTRYRLGWLSRTASVSDPHF